MEYDASVLLVAKTGQKAIVDHSYGLSVGIH
ncbi:MAG: hypothetical protein ACD_62C00188G0002 [uncultured bacterium]|nr:MAG: hypothetical protein ACD_62C00188G0002 [uncultured bacterium]